MRVRTPGAGLFLWLLLAGTPALAASIAGRLLDPSGQPLPGANVQWFAYRDDDQLLLDRTAGREPHALGQTSTDAQGRFRISLDRPGASVSLRVVAAGFSSLRLAGPYSGGEAAALEDLFAAPARPLSGTVVDESGAPVANALVSVETSEPGDAQAVPIAETRTGGNGTFDLPEAPDGPRTIAVSAPGFVSISRIQLEPRGEERVVLARGGVVHGTVADAAGRPVAAALVLAETMAVETDARGAYRLTGIAPGMRSIVAIQGEEFAARRDDVRVRKGEETHIPLRLARASVLSGIVVDESTRRPLAGAKVAVSEPRGFSLSSSPMRRGRTDPRGRYRIGGLASRRYSVTASRDGFLSTTITAVGVSTSGATANIALRRAATLAGRVTDERAQAVAGARVRLVTPAGPRVMLRRLRAGGVPAALLGETAAVTGPDGSFRLKNVTPGRNLELEATRAGYAPARRAGVTVKPGESLSNLALQLRKGLEAHGRVVDAQGNAVPGAQVRAILHDSSAAAIRGQLRLLGMDRELPDAWTGSDGKFVVKGMEEGEYTVLVSREGFARKTAPSLWIRGSGENAWPPIVLAAGAAVAGLIRDTAGRPVPGARIIGVEPGGAGARPTDTSSDVEGRFRIDGLSADHVILLNVSASGFASIQKSVMPPAADVMVVLKTAGALRGRVEDAESKQPIVDFSIARTGGRGAGFAILLGAAGGDRAFHSEDGTFELAEVPPGKWTVRASASGYRSADLSGIEVGEGETKEGIVLSLKKGGSVTGRVLDAMRGGGVANASVSWRPSDGGGGPAAFARAPGGGNGGGTTSDADGRFQLDGLPSGRVTISASHPDYLDTTRDLDSDKESSVDLMLGSGGVISGSVVGQDGRTGVAGAQVSLNPEGDTSARFHADSARSDGSGQFLFEHLAGGRYQLVAQSAAGKTTTQEVVLADNQRVDGVLLAMASGASIRGTVSGLPAGRLGGVRVTATGTNYSDSAMTDDSGAFLLMNVPSGVVRLQATTSFLSGRSTGKTIEVPDGASDVPAEIVFEGVSRLAGRITRSEKPLSAIQVNAMLTSPSASSSRAGAQTDENGQYALEGLDDGDYVVSLSGQGVAYRRTFTVSGDTNGDVALPPIQVRGVVTDGASGEPLDGATVSIQPAQAGSGLSMKGTTSDSTGHYFIDDVDPGSYQATARRSGYRANTQTVTVGSDSVESNFALQKGEGVSVLVVDGLTGLPLHSVTVAAFGADSSVAYAGAITLDSSGKGDISSLGPGRYLLYVFSDGYASRSAPVDVPSQGASIAMTPGGRVQVRTAVPMSGQLVDASGARYLVNPWRADGRVTLAPPVSSWDHVAPGSYRLVAGPAGAERAFDFAVVEGQTVVVEVR